MVKIALIALCTLFVLEQALHLATPARGPKVIAKGRYLPAPGNTILCPSKQQNGRVYAGYLSTQADSSTGPVIVHCVYLTPRAGLI